jgi:hypothetical protein
VLPHSSVTKGSKGYVSTRKIIDVWYTFPFFLIKFSQPTDIWLISWQRGRVYLKKLVVAQLDKKFPMFNKTRRFIRVYALAFLETLRRATCSLSIQSASTNSAAPTVQYHPRMTAMTHLSDISSAFLPCVLRASPI